jgi:branched-chain amino acid transport system ATP-binding protein
MTAAIEPEVSGLSVSAAHLQIRDLRASYDNQVALHGVSIDVTAGSCTAILGSNGAGKSTLMNAVAGIHRPVVGEVELDGQRIERLRGHRISRSGVCYIPEGRGVFPDLTVGENLRLTVGRDAAVRDRLFSQLPALAPLTGRQAGSLSGGEQQMLAMAPAIVGGYRLLMVDELSLGLAPMIVDTLFELLASIRRTGVTILLVEQFAERALELADYAYVLRKGNVVFDGPSEVLRGDEAALHRLYMGGGSGEREPHDEG